MPDTAAQDDEQDFSIPGQDQEESLGVPPSALGGPQPPPAQPAPVTQSQNATATPSGPPPKASGRAMFLGNLLKTILSGVQNAPGNPKNSFDQGFQSASPQAQQQRAQQQQMAQAKVSQAQSAADIAKAQVALIPLKALKYEYQVKALPQQLQDEHMEQIQKHAEFFVKNGAEVVSTADDEKSADAATVQARANDPRSVQHLGMFLTMPDPEQDGKFSTMYFPNKELLQSDLKNADGKVLMKAGTPLVPAVGKALEDQQNDIKDFVKEMHGSLGNSKPPETQDAADQRLAQLNSFTSIAGKTDPVWTKLAQDETANIQKNYASLPKTAAAAKLAQAKAMATQVTIPTKEAELAATDADKVKQAAKGGEDAMNYADSYVKSGQYTGPGDEALMEKFFELAKPSTGFRMSQPQIDMLKNARSWLDSAEAQARHAKDGTWFSTDQRKQIAGTMKQLATAKGAKSAPQPIYASAPGKPRMVSNDGGKTWTPVQ